jgi:transposase InsO family protein
MQSISTSATIERLRQCFARHGDFQKLVTNNGTTFTSIQFANFCKERGVQHLRTAPYHPASNGLAERFVDTLKRSLGKMKNEGNIHQILQTFLHLYRSTPNPSSVHRVSPSEALYGRVIRTNMSLVKPPNNIPQIRNEK